MTDILLSFDSGSVDWARAQFALTAIYHWLFVPLTLGLALIMGIMETCYYRTQNEFWGKTARFWQKLFGINFAMGVATGIILEFEFGTNWSNYSWFVGDIFGAPLAIEGIIAFFLESTFVAVMFFGWKKVSKRVHLLSTWLTGSGATFSAWWILVANAWMQNPVGCSFNPDTMRNEMVSFVEVALSPFAVDKFLHTVISSWIIGALFVAAVSGWYLLKRREQELSVASLKVAGIVGLVASLLAMHSGDKSAYSVAQVQPMKLAAMEALYDGGQEQGLTAIALINPFKQPDFAASEQHPLKIEIPYALSFLATRDIHGYVPGVNDIIKGGYTMPNGSVALSYDEKVGKGKQAIAWLSEYRNLKNQNNDSCPDYLKRKQVLETNLASVMPYFGYGFVDSAADLVPYIPVCFYAFRIMVGLGTLFLLFFILIIFFVYYKDITKVKWLLMASVAMLPLGYIASEAGWLVAEFGRQPWAIQDMLPTWVGVSDISSSNVMLTFFIFLALFTTLLAVEINIMLRAIRKGPEHEQE